ncbi:MAG TPA: tetratricopeptide repeat protein [Dongiaceae bacterium]|nr:tetratricopeptide repeat protein [Dongiaceae bacterium]
MPRRALLRALVILTLAAAFAPLACGGPGLDAGLAEARRLRIAGRPAEALVLLNGLDKRHPGDARVLYERAEALHATGKEDQALADTSAALQAQPDLFDAQVLHGVLQAATGHEQEGLATLRRMVATDPNRAGVHRAMAIIQAKEGRLGPAVAQFELELKNHPNDAATLTDVGVFYLQTGQMENATDRLARAAALPDAPAKAHQYYAEILFKQAKREEGLAEQRKALALAPDDGELIVNHARALVGYGHPEEATKVLEAALARGVQDPRVLLERARQAREALDYPGATDYLTRAIALDPSLAEAQMDLGKVHLFQGHLAEARAAFEAARRLAPTDAYAPYYLANLLADEGHYDEAVPLLERSLELDPLNPKAHYSLAQAYQRLGRAEEAKGEFAKHGEILRRLREAGTMSGTATSAD